MLPKVIEAINFPNKLSAMQVQTQLFWFGLGLVLVSVLLPGYSSNECSEMAEGFGFESEYDANTPPNDPTNISFSTFIFDISKVSLCQISEFKSQGVSFLMDNF